MKLQNARAAKPIHNNAIIRSFDEATDKTYIVSNMMMTAVVNKTTPAMLPSCTEKP
jgi:hypothetical protein